MQTIQTGVTILAAEGGHHVVNELIFPAWVFGWGVFAVLMLLLLVTLSFTSVGKRHPAPTTAVDTHGTGHGAHRARH
ncbi:hypothetical protein [Micrococcus terreus]|uniref:Uncharacterized protein n=1 Tax=Micrococcus terreus TaxID=574650 RepID=A0A1I7MG01_9MICC|nr:hypothetical protein [Micrococcus terreus]MCT2089819.1 hypothetical protein [Micrococcus terreus]MDK7702314.1 hypothetical protein [Micrococcus terreus]WOO98115.1 hypothetical protein R3I42_02930 [Micrococcus terreus]SFV20861.1 hypothetical protein SAMN04487966_10255 [Micrococcus terreus]